MRQYGIMMRRFDDELHRGPMTLEQAQDWIESWVEAGGKEDAFYIVSREVGSWQ